MGAHALSLLSDTHKCTGLAEGTEGLSVVITDGPVCMCE